MIILGRFKASKFIVLVYQTHRELITPSVWRPDSIQRSEHFELSVIKKCKAFVHLQTDEARLHGSFVPSALNEEDKDGGWLQKTIYSYFHACVVFNLFSS